MGLFSYAYVPSYFFEILGDLYLDRITRLRGVVVSKVIHLTGISRVYLQPQMKTNQKAVQEGRWVDTNTLERVNEGINKSEKPLVKKTKKSGGPQRDPRPSHNRM